MRATAFPNASLPDIDDQEWTPPEIPHLSALIDISRVLWRRVDAAGCRQEALDIVAGQRYCVSAVLWLGDDAGGLQTAFTAGEPMGARLQRIAEDLAARVVESGRPRVQLNGTTRFDGSGPAGPSTLSFVCAPVRADGSVAGALLVSLLDLPGRELDRIAQFVRAAAAMLGCAMAGHRRFADDRRQLEEDNHRLRLELRRRHESPRLAVTLGGTALARLGQAAAGNGPTLLRGEPGIGKETAARAIHQQSGRSATPFVVVACAGIPDSVIASELFGWQRSDRHVLGHVDAAQGGTLYLDEITALSLPTQGALLRLLQTREFRRIDGGEILTADVRVIAATSKDLEHAVANGAFREDLYYRLKGGTITLSPLRERRADLPLLVDVLLEQAARRRHRPAPRIAASAIDLLTQYHWPGNLNELEHVIERAVAASDGAVIHDYHLTPLLQTGSSDERISLAASVKAYERALIDDALRTTRGNRAKAARLLDTTDRIFNYKAKHLGIDVTRYRSRQVPT